jgi:hypothetical protein
MIPGEGNHAATGEGIFFRICKKSVGDPVCKRNIEMTPPGKVQMTLFRFLGLRKDVSDDGGVDEQTGVFAA